MSTYISVSYKVAVMKKVFLYLSLVLSILPSFAGSDNSQATELYNKGKEKVTSLHRSEAKDLFSQAIAIDPNFAEAYYERALIHKHFKEVDKAITDFESVTRIESELKIPAFFEVGKLKLKSEDYDGAFKSFDNIISKENENIEALVLRGQASIYLKNFKDARADFVAANALDANNLDALFYKGYCETELKLYNEAIAIFDQVIAKDKKYSDAYFYRAYCQYQLVIEAGENHVKEHLHKAEDDYTKALALDPTLEEAYFDRGEVRMQLKKYVDAIADFKKAIEIKPNDLEAHYQKAMCNYHYGYEEKAFKEFKSILEMDSTYANAHFMVGMYLYEIQEFDESEVEFTKLMKVETEHADAHYWRGLARIELGIYEGACEDLNRAAEMGMKVEKTVYHAARCDAKHE